MKIFMIMILSISLLYGIDKNQNRQNTSTALIQLNIETVQNFDFMSFESTYLLELKYCVGTSICFFKPKKDADLEKIVKNISIYGKANIYRPYRLKVY